MTNFALVKILLLSALYLYLYVSLFSLVPFYCHLSRSNRAFTYFSLHMRVFYMIFLFFLFRQ